MPILLKTESLQTGYPRGAVLNIAEDLELRAGELVGVLGRNGAGKSALLRTWAGWLPARAGRFWVAGQAAQQLSAAAYARLVAVVNTARVDVPHLRVRELVAWGRMPHTGWFGRLAAADWAAADAALERMSIAALADKEIGRCSDGERQLAMLARAVVQDTPVLLLDEITAHLDYWHREAVFGLLRGLCADGKLVVLISHELALVQQHAHRLLWAGDGRLVERAAGGMDV